jgi:hypothetical protein
MTEDNRDARNEDRVYGTDLHPRHESWARISTRGSMIGFVIFLVLAGLFVLWVNLRH